MSNLIEIPAAKYKKEIPDCVDEMSGKDFIFFSGLFLKVQVGLLTPQELREHMLLRFMDVDVNRYIYRRMKVEEKSFICSNVAQLASELITFLIEEEEGDEGKINVKFKHGFVFNPLKKLHGLKGPADALQDINFMQYKDAYLAFRDFNENHRPQSLNELVAALYYRGKKWDKIKSLHIARKVAKWKDAEKYAVYLFFWSCLEWLQDAKIEVEGNTIDLSILYKNFPGDEPIDTGTGINGLLFKIAEAGIWGDIEKSAQQGLYDILVYLYHQRKIQLETYKRRKK